MLPLAADRSIAYFWSIPRSQLYREFSRLEGLGLIAGTRVSQTSAPEKRVYEITEAGRVVLAAWVSPHRQIEERVPVEGVHGPPRTTREARSTAARTASRWNAS